MTKPIFKVFRWIFIEHLTINTMLLIPALITVLILPSYVESGGYKEYITLAFVFIICPCIIVFLNYLLFKSFLMSPKNKDFKISFKKTTSLKIWWWFSWRFVLSLIPSIVVYYLIKNFIKPFSLATLSAYILFTGVYVYLFYYFIKALFNEKHTKFSINLSENKKQRPVHIAFIILIGLILIAIAIFAYTHYAAQRMKDAYNKRQNTQTEIIDNKPLIQNDLDKPKAAK